MTTPLISKCQQTPDTLYCSSSAALSWRLQCSLQSQSVEQSKQRADDTAAFSLNIKGICIRQGSSSDRVCKLVLIQVIVRGHLAFKLNKGRFVL